MRLRNLFAALFCFSSGALFASVKDTAGTSGAAFLAIPVSVRSMGMGDAGVALPSGANGAQLNPASLSLVRRFEASFSYQDILADSSLGFLGFAKPLRYRGMSQLGGSTVFGNLVYVSKGTIEVNMLNANGSLKSSENRSAGYDLAVGFGYAENIFRTGLGIFESGLHSVGLTGRVIHSNLAGTYDAQAGSVDLGYLADFKTFGFGFSVANIGSKIKFLEVGDPLPVVMRTGFSVRRHVGALNMSGAYDLLHQEKTVRHRLGGEIAMASGVSIRAGWRFEPVSFQGGPSAGFGVDLNHFFMDYAFNWFGDLRDTHRLLLGLRFGSTLR